MHNEFFRVFTGLDRAHGQYIIKDNDEGGKVKGRAKTVLRPPTADLWKLHLDGKLGLGIIPICSDNTCVWGAIDIDVYDLDLVKMEKIITEHKIPAVVCRTKSGGAHLYFFVSEPIPAGDMRDKLDELAAILGFPGVEIFPKQVKLANDKDVGNWINMPYFNSGKTLRYAIHKGKAIEADVFLKLVKTRTSTPEELKAFKIKDAGTLADGPPCLQHYCKVGFPQGSRNHALFSMGVYAKLKHGDDWEEVVDKYNHDYMGPGSSREVQNIIKQLRKKDYFYKCNDQPLVAMCNKNLCARRKFGIGNDNAEVPFVLGTLVKIDSSPPLWFIDVDGHRLELTTEDLIDQNRFRKICVETIHKFPRRMKGPKWEDLISERLENLEIIEAPKDAGVEGQFVALLEKFFARPIADTREQLLLGKHWKDEDGKYVKQDFVVFRSTDFMTFLDRERFREYKPRDVWGKLRTMGANHGQFNIKGKCVQYWAMPEPNMQSENFSLPEEKTTPF
ncbi:hypothetical protein KAR91_14920 [Candidatus Pacearchaeota archaeon]|nr:hypothetical protein [Candidatus Pacearchaeota archaeon]